MVNTVRSKKITNCKLRQGYYKLKKAKKKELFNTYKE